MFVLDPRVELTSLVAPNPPGESLKSRAAGAYLGLAIGDALGATLEFMTPREIRHKYGVHREIRGGGWLRLRAGQVTDDTEMSLALGNSILAHGAVDPGSVAEAFSDWMRTKPVDIGNTVRSGISRYRQTGETQVPENEYDAGNGACMRCLPVALAYLGADEMTVAEANRRPRTATSSTSMASSLRVATSAVTDTISSPVIWRIMSM